MVTDTDPNLVSAAAAGDPAALERLVSDHLPLVYNIVGRALPVAADVDDVVQETMLRVVRGLPALRDPYVFRSWLVAVAMNQVRDHVRAYSGRPRPLDEAPEFADPGADFADLTLTELGLTGQRREVAMATAWLDDDDRELLSLWWLVEAGHLTRGDLVSAIGLEPHHVTVRIARMKAQLEISRAVVRALCAVPICLELSDLAMQWHGRPEPLWRKRFARHTRQCATCAGLATDFVPAERLLVRLPLVPIPFGLADALHRAVPAALHSAAMHPTAATAQMQMPMPMAPTGPAAPMPSGAPGPMTPATHSHRRIGRAGARSAASHFATKAAVALAATAAVVGAVVVTTGASDSSKTEAQAGSGTTSASADGTTGSSAVTSPTPSDSLSSTSASSTSAAPSSRSVLTKPSPSTSKSTMKPSSQSSAGSSSVQSSSHASVPPPPTTRSTTPSSAPTSSDSDAASQVLAVINQARAGQGLAPLTITSGLTKSAAAHTSVMASGCGLSHQCPGEAGLGDRETAAGVSWSSAGENIGDGGPVSDTNSAIASMAVGLTNSMLAEQPPDDGHRKNILSTSFRHIGISVYRDSSGTVWMTQDFSD